MKKKSNNNKIDFVILWVDNNDEKWQKEKIKYENKNNIDVIDNSIIRYRDWDILKYWFRGVEKFAPWVNKIHFVTCGQIPKWLDTNNPKLNIVNHADFMPKDSLPTFNSNAIELPIYKIKDLQEQFVLFNDDVFIINKTKKEDFFKKGKPCNSMSLAPVIPDEKGRFYKTVSNDIEIINKNIDFRTSVRKNLLKYLSLKQGKYVLKTYPLLIYKRFVGFANFHLSISYLKSTFETVWKKENEKLNKTVHNKFRNYENDISHWVFNYYQFATGNYVQKSNKFGINLSIDNPSANTIIKKQKYKMIGLGDNDSIKNFEEVKKNIVESFEFILPNKSSFEK